MANTAVSPKEKTVKVKLPKLRNGAKEQMYVQINDRRWMVKRGIEVEVPEYVAWQLGQLEESAEEADKFIEENARN